MNYPIKWWLYLDNLGLVENTETHMLRWKEVLCKQQEIYYYYIYDFSQKYRDDYL